VDYLLESTIERSSRLDFARRVLVIRRTARQLAEIVYFSSPCGL
jgi:hypothetical protein